MRLNNIKNRVISAILITILLLTSSNLVLIPAQAAVTTPSVEHSTAFNPDWEIEKLEDDVAKALVPEVQVLRVSLVKTVSAGTDDWRKGGMPATKEDIPELVQNPIHLVPENYKAIWGDEITPKNIHSPKNIDPTRLSKGLNVFNSRREYLANDEGPSGTVLAYGAGWSVDYDESGNIINQQWVFNDSKFNTQQIEIVFPDKCVGNTVSDIGGDANAFYQDNPPTGTNINSSMSASEYFDAISSAVFIDSEYGSNSMKQVFIYHIIADMLGYPDDPYCDEVEKVVQEKIITKQYKILVEPMITFDVRKSQALKAMYGNIEYISLTAGDLNTEDAISTVFYGASSPKALAVDPNGQSNRYRNFNPITHGTSSSSFMSKFYESIMLKNTDKTVNLHSVDDTEYFNSAFKEGTNYSISSGQAYEGRQTGPLLNGQKGASVTTPFYKSVSINIEENGGNPANTTCKVDMFSMLHTGAMYILPVAFDKIDYKADTLVPYNNNLHRDSQPISELNNCPVYDRDSIYVDENGLNCIDIKAISSLNFEIDSSNMPATQWNNKISLNNQTDLVKDNAYIKQIDSEALNGTVFIPALTKNLLYVEMTDKDGNGTETIQVDTDSGAEKIRIENAHMYGFGKDSTTNKYIGLPVSMSVSNHSKGNEDKRDNNGELCVGHNLPTYTSNGNTNNIFEDKNNDSQNFMKLALPAISNIPADVAYLKIVFQVNRGKFEDSDTYMSNNVSRPQGKESAGSDMPCVLTGGGELEYFGEVEHNFDNNTKIIYVKLENSLDLSADTISRNNSNPIITKNPIKVSQCNINTTATANNGAIKSSTSDTTTQQTLYYYFSNINTNDFENLFNTASENTDWSNPNIITELVNKFNQVKDSHHGSSFTKQTPIKPQTAGIDPMDINWEECATSSELDPSQTIYLHLALIVNSDNSIPNEDTYENNVTFESFPYDIPDDNPTPPSSSALSCYVPTGTSSGLPLRILNNSNPINYVTGIYNSKVLEANNDANKVDGSLDSRYGAKIRVEDVPNTSATGYRPDPQYTEYASIVVSRCNGKNEQSEPEDTPDWVFYDKDDLIFHEIAFKYLSYDPTKKKYYVATQVIPYTKRVIENTPCDCDDGCSSPTVTYHYYRLNDTQTVDYTLIFDDLYSQDSNVSSSYSLESLLNQESEQGKYWYIATNGSLIGLTLRTRLISDFPNFSSTTDKTTGAGVPLNKGIVQLSDSRGTFNSNNNIQAELELTDFEYLRHIGLDYNNTSGPSQRAGAVKKSNDYYSSILTSPSGFSNNFTSNATTLDTAPKLNRDTDALYGANLNGTNPNSTWQFSTYPINGNTLTQDYINVRYYRFDIKPNTSRWNGTLYSTRNQRGIITDPNQSDSVKINKFGTPTINNQDIISKKLTKNGKSIADAIDRYTYGYVGTRLKPIIYTDNLYLPGNNLDSYSYTTSSGATLENSHTSLIGLCADFNQVMLDTTYNSYTFN